MLSLRRFVPCYDIAGKSSELSRSLLLNAHKPVLSQGSQGQAAIRGQQVSDTCVDRSLSDTRCPNQQNSLGKAREEVFN